MNRTTLSPTRGRVRWKHCRDAEAIRSDDRRKETEPFAHHHFSSTVLSSGTSSGDRTLGVLSATLQEEAKDKTDDEIKLASLEALVLEELAMHFILNSNRSRAFEDARLEVVGGEDWFENSLVQAE